MEKTSEAIKVKMSIKKKLLITLIPIVALVFIIVSVVLILQASGTIQERTYTLLDRENSQCVHQIQANVDEVLAELNALHGTLEQMNASDDEIMSYLEYTMTVDSRFPYGIYMGDKNGKYFDASWVPDEGYVPSERGWYKDGINSKTMIFGAAYVDTQTNDLCISASSKLWCRGDDDMVISADLYLNNISDIVKQYKIMENGKCYLVDCTDGVFTVLASDDDSTLGLTVSELPETNILSASNAVLATADGSMNDVSCEGTAYTVCAKKLDKVDWLLVSVVPTSDITGKINVLRVTAAAIIVLGLIVVMFAIVVDVNRIVKPLKSLTGNIGRMSKGDFTVKIKSSGNDEIALISNELDEFTDSMVRVFTDIGQASGKLAVQADNSANVSGELSTSAESQSQSMNKLNSNVEELAKAISVVADSATELAGIVAETGTCGNDANEMMKSTVKITEEGRIGMEKIQSSMQEIASTVNALQKTVTEVGNSTGEITKFVQMIGEIASQTNLLSLNAAIEAARAGEAGRGFAVVSDEIRNLADNSANAVAEISQITGGINGLVAETVEQTKKSAECINESVSVVASVKETFDTIYEEINKTSEILDQMVDGVKRVDDVASSVAAITEEQAASTEEILATAEDLSGLANVVSDNSRTVAGDAEEIAGAAEVLTERLAEFKI